jgi:hypothetical protein
MFRELLQELLNIRGVTYCCLADGVMGNVLDSAGTEERDEPGVPIAVLGWGATAAGFLSAAAADELDDLILTTRRAYHLVRQFEDGAAGHPLVIYLRLERNRANLALARRELAAVRLWPGLAGAGARSVPALPPGTGAPPAPPARLSGGGNTFASIPSSQVNRPTPLLMPKSAPAPEMRSAPSGGPPRPSPTRRPSPVPRGGPGPSPPISSEAGPAAAPAQEMAPAQRSPMLRPLQRRPVGLSAHPMVISALPTAPAPEIVPEQRSAAPTQWVNDVSTISRLLTALRNWR